MAKRHKRISNNMNNNTGNNASTPPADGAESNGEQAGSEVQQASANSELKDDSAEGADQTGTGETNEAQGDEAAPVSGLKKNDDLADDPIPPSPPAAVLDESMMDPRVRESIVTLNQTFDTYVTNMKRGRPLTNDEGVRSQTALWALIKWAISRPGEEFHAVFAQLMARMLAERGEERVLDPRLRYRFFGALTMGRVDARNFERILAALVSLCNPQERKIALKQVDLQDVFKNYPDKAGAQRVFEFFGL